MPDINDFLRSLPEGAGETPAALARITGQSNVPALWRAFAPFGASLIDQSFVSRLREGAEGLASGRRRYEDELMTTLASSGVNPIFAQNVLAGTENVLGEQVGQLVGGLEGQRFDELFNLGTGITQALAASDTQERSLELQRFLAAKSRQAQRHGQKRALQQQLFSDIAGLALFAVPGVGPALGALKTAFSPGITGGGPYQLNQTPSSYGVTQTPYYNSPLR